MSAKAVHVAINAQLVSFGRSYRNAGVSRYTYNLLDGLTRVAGDDLFTIFISADEMDAAMTSSIGKSAHMHLVPVRWPGKIPAARILWEQLALAGEVRRAKVDVFHAPVNILPGGLPCPSVVTVHDLAFLRYPQFFRPARRAYQTWFTQRSVRQATRIAAASESTKQDLQHYTRASPSHIDVIYPGIADDFRPQSDSAALAAFRRKHQLPDRYLLFLGTLEPRKNLIGLLNAYAELRRQWPDTPQLVIAGAKGWYYDEVFERVRTLALANAVTFAGYVEREEQPLWYASAEAFVYPSYYEGFGIPVVEALACGVPTLTSDVSSLPEAGGNVALLVSPDNRDAMAQAMRRLLTDTALRETSVREGPRWAARFTVDSMSKAYLDTYRRASQA